MRVMIFAKGDSVSQVAPPDPSSLERMQRFNEELVSAGVLLAADRLRPSSDGVRIHWDAGKPTVVDGPFTEAKELVAGYWLWQVRSLDEAIEWVKRAPFGPGTQLEIRPIHEF